MKSGWHTFFIISTTQHRRLFLNSAAVGGDGLFLLRLGVSTTAIGVIPRRLKTNLGEAHEPLPTQSN
jgi:hypothetical protein